jgi:hypothetical protein
MVAVPLIKDRLEAFSFDVDSETAPTDAFIQPLQLGWRFPRADVTAAYGVFVPVGEFHAGNHDNAGLGMFSHELSLGTTVYLNKTRQWHAAANLAYEMHTNKPGIDLDVGDLVTVEGGVGRTFVKPVGKPVPMITNLGLAYYLQFKATEDSGVDVRPRLRGLKDRVFAIGPEFNIYVPQMKALFAVRYLPEFGARNTSQGQSIFVSLTFEVKSFLPTPAEPPPAERPAP